MTAPSEPSSPSRSRPRPIVLIVIDGFGIGPVAADDAIARASMPVWRGLLARWPHSVLRASEDAVGLPAGQMGNSEVGHLNLGAGRPVLQDLPRIDAAIADGSFMTRPALVAACDRAARPGQQLHVVSLVGPGGVHANDRHLVALVALAATRGVGSVRVHALLDGRDTPPRSALAFVDDLERRLGQVHRDARIATVGGRYFAMDRDQRWERIAQGYRAIVHGVGEVAPSATAAIRAAYARDENDEFVTPTVIDGVDGRVRDGDAIVHANFRADRARQLTHALADGDTFHGFDRDVPEPRPRDLLVVTMTEYESGLPVEVAFGPEEAYSLAHAASDAGWRQFHVAETEKYAHVTYFFNGGREAPLPGEDRRLVPSPKVATYDLQPEMSAPGVTDALLEALATDRYDLIVANFANPDMVGHTGVWDAAVRAVETIDGCLGRIVAALDARDALMPDAPGSLLAITADHGNADQMRDAAGNPVTAHSLNPVPFLLAGRAADGRTLRDGVLADVAPTLCELAGLPRWDGMTGRSLLEPRSGSAEGRVLSSDAVPTGGRPL
ncbi:MAG TPA: 2,3-bisphosphoglycerate-independent phosphoglycerate mutase [Candidatus Limnocylindrales bacterium]|nr:2,3-bisphosphoglycerate-independent phosphoglycerate mutase [Candidatus Limnocylindrales bacterium]